MRLAFVADLRSPIALQWIRYFTGQGHEVLAISSHPVPQDVLPGAEMVTLPLVLAGSGRNATAGDGRSEPARRSSLSGRAWQWATPRRVSSVRCVIGPAMVRAKQGRLQRLIDQYQPDLVHAMRIPFEGIAAGPLTGPPVIVSVWGNDLTLFADRTRAMAKATRRALAGTAVLHCDCYRDAVLASEWGLPDGREVWVFPGNGGVDRSVFHPGTSDLPGRLGIPDGAPVILNPRGIREYVRTDTFFAALGPVFGDFPEAHAVCAGMAGSRYAESLIAAEGLDPARVHLLPPVDHRLMAGAFRAARVSVSLSEHDGTPNTLLEAMACGALPVVGDVASVREWITEGVNGLVVPAADPALVAAALTRALTDESLLRAAREENVRLIAERADYDKNLKEVESRYEAVASARRQRSPR